MPFLPPKVLRVNKHTPIPFSNVSLLDSHLNLSKSLGCLKSTTYGPRKAQNKEDDQSYGLDADQRFFYGVSFSRLVALNEKMPHMSRDHE